MVGTYLRQLRQVLDERTGTGRPGRARQAADILWCTARYGASPANYLAFHFEGMPSRLRGSYITYRDNRALMRRYNRPEGVAVLDDKARFSEHFSAWLGREVLDCGKSGFEEIQSFLGRHAEVVVKPRREGQGRGVQVLDAAELGGRVAHRAFLAGLMASGVVMEEALEQNAAVVDAFGPGLAPVRLVTLIANSRVDVVLTSITLGVSGRVVNPHTGGLVTPVERETGRLGGPAVEKDGTEHERHPGTGQAFEGFVLPDWSAVLELGRELALALPEAGWVGWDIGLTPAGPVVIEGNSDPGTYVGLQRAAGARRWEGLRSRIEDYL